MRRLLLTLGPCLSRGLHNVRSPSLPLRNTKHASPSTTVSSGPGIVVSAKPPRTDLGRLSFNPKLHFHHFTKYLFCSESEDSFSSLESGVEKASGLIDVPGVSGTPSLAAPRTRKVPPALSGHRRLTSTARETPFSHRAPKYKGQHLQNIQAPPLPSTCQS